MATWIHNIDKMGGDMYSASVGSCRVRVAPGYQYTWTGRARYGFTVVCGAKVYRGKRQTASGAKRAALKIARRKRR